MINLLKTSIIGCVAFFLCTILLSLLIRPLFLFNTSGYVNGLDRLDIKIRQLALCESGGNPNSVHYNDGAIGLHSYGLLQFQPPTFTAYWRSLINGDTEVEEAGNLLKDPQAQMQLARAMLEKNPNNIRHWRNCGIRIGML